MGKCIRYGYSTGEKIPALGGESIKQELSWVHFQVFQSRVWAAGWSAVRAQPVLQNAPVQLGRYLSSIGRGWKDNRDDYPAIAVAVILVWQGESCNEIATQHRCGGYFSCRIGLFRQLEYLAGVEDSVGIQSLPDGFHDSQATTMLLRHVLLLADPYAMFACDCASQMER